LRPRAFASSDVIAASARRSCACRGNRAYVCGVVHASQQTVHNGRSQTEVLRSTGRRKEPKSRGAALNENCPGRTACPCWCSFNTGEAIRQTSRVGKTARVGAFSKRPPPVNVATGNSIYHVRKARRVQSPEIRPTGEGISRVACHHVGEVSSTRYG